MNTIKDRLPNKQDGWIGYSINSMARERKYFIRVLVFESGGYGSRIIIRPFRVLLIGDWTMENDECEIATGSFMDDENSDWVVTHWMPLPKPPSNLISAQGDLFTHEDLLSEGRLPAPTPAGKTNI